MKSLLFVCLFFIGFCSAVIFPTIIFIGEHCVTKDDMSLLKNYSTIVANANRCHSKGFISIFLQPERTRMQHKTNGIVQEQLEFLQVLVRDAFKCDEEVKKFGLDCLPPEGRDYIKRTELAYHQIKEYMFGQNSERSVKFIQNGGVECLLKEKIINECYRPNLVLLNSSSIAESEERIYRYYTTEKNCVEKLMKENCPNAFTYISNLIDIARSAGRTPKNESHKEEGTSIFEGSKYGILSIASSRSRVAREIGGAGSKLPHIESRLKYLCSYNSELTQSIDNMKTCLRLKPMFETPKAEYIKHVDQCSEETRRNLKKCLPEKQKYFPDFFFKLVESVLELLYDDIGEIARGLSPCMSRLKTEESEEDYQDCILQTGAKFDDQALDSKESFCKKFIEISKCFIKQLNDTCTTNNDLEKFKNDYLIAMERPCK